MDKLIDPFKNFRFRVSWHGKYVAGITRITALRRTTEVIKHSESADPGLSRKSPGKTEFESVTLERGITHDTDFESWANQVWSLAAGKEHGPPQGFRKDMRIEVFDDSGLLVLAYTLYRCWVSEFQALPDLDAGANAVAIESIKVEIEGWQREVLAPDQ